MSTLPRVIADATSLTRRAVLASTLVTLTGCAIDPRSGTPQASASPSADTALAIQVRSRLQGVLTLSAKPRRRLEIAASALAADHVQVLERALPKPLPATGALESPGTFRQALTLLETELVASVREAEGGPLAALLASMAAGWRQLIDPPLAKYWHLSGPSAPVEALQVTLAGEHAALYVMEVCAAQTSFTRQRALWRQLDAAVGRHLVLRDQLSAAITSAGQSPVPAAAAYDLPKAMRGPQVRQPQVLRAARAVESACTRNYLAQIQVVAQTEREWPLQALVTAAQRELHFGGTPQPLPGWVEGVSGPTN